LPLSGQPASWLDSADASSRILPVTLDSNDALEDIITALLAQPERS